MLSRQQAFCGFLAKDRATNEATLRHMTAAVLSAAQKSAAGFSCLGFIVQAYLLPAVWQPSLPKQQQQHALLAGFYCCALAAQQCTPGAG